jgi:hypothetical protein
MSRLATLLLFALALFHVGLTPRRSFALDWAKLPANTWTEIPFTTEQPAGSQERGQYGSQGWNKLVYDPVGKRALFYDRWLDKTHGGQTIYGNCLFAFDPATSKLAPLKIDNWSKRDTETGGYRTFALPANEGEPTPAPRHVYHAFEFIPGQNVLYIANGANQSVVDAAGKLVGHDECDGTWRLDVAAGRWTKVASTEHPPNRLDDAMCYSPETNTLVYAAHQRQLWLLDLKSGQWRKAKGGPPARTAMGATIFHDPPRKRMLIVGGGALDAWQKGPAPEFRELYAYDPATDKSERLADAPTALYSAHLAYDSKRDLFFTVANFNGKEQPSGMFVYDPRKNAWSELKPTGGIPPHRSWMGWMQLVYAPEHDALIGKIREKFYGMRYEP